MHDTIVAKAPAKLILAGEYTIIKNHQGLALAVNCYAKTTIKTNHHSSMVLLNLFNLKYQKEFTVIALAKLRYKLKENYQQFLSGDFLIKDVLKKPFHLLQYTVGEYLSMVNDKLPHGVKLLVDSSIPVGCGMGSSAATVLSTMQALSAHSKLDLSKQSLMEFCKNIEQLQHGHTTGFDVKAIAMGGFTYHDHDEVVNETFIDAPISIINTGTPIVSTGECVENVLPRITKKLLKESERIIKTMHQAILNKQLAEFKQAIRDQHQLMITFGVVPIVIQQMIVKLEAVGIVAKVCGAGTTVGDKAGTVLLIGEIDQKVRDVVSQYNCLIQSIKVDTKGVHIV